MESDSSKHLRQLACETTRMVIKARFDRKVRLLQERQAAYEKWCHRLEGMG
jgi:hypothetical protein